MDVLQKLNLEQNVSARDKEENMGVRLCRKTFMAFFLVAILAILLLEVLKILVNKGDEAQVKTLTKFLFSTLIKAINITYNNDTQNEN